MKEREVHNKI